MPKGNLLDLCQEEQLPVEDKLILARQAASGMNYLEGEKIVHCDLSLRKRLLPSYSAKLFVRKYSCDIRNNHKIHDQNQ